MEAESKKLSDELATIRQEFEPLERDIATKTTEIADLVRQIKAKTTEKQALEADATNLEQAVSDLTKQKLDLIRDKEVLEGEIQASETELFEAKNNYNLEMRQINKELAEAKINLRKTLDKLKDVATTDKAMRESLAEQQLRLQKQDENLRRREILVSQGENKLRDNANLLNL